MVLVAGFWRRAAAGLIDAVVVLPISLALSWIASLITGLRLPPARHAGIDYWLDLSLAGDPTLWGTLGLSTCVVALYLFLFQTVTARTPGMRVLGLRVIDVYGRHPSPMRIGLRMLGYLACTLTLGLGFLWIGFDREKRGLHDWLGGSYVIKDLAHEGAPRSSPHPAPGGA